MRIFKGYALFTLSVLLLSLSMGCSPVVVTVQEFPTTPDAVRALRGDTVQAVYGDFPAMGYAARESAGTLEVVRRQFDTANFAIAVAQPATGLRDAITAALSQVVEEGAYGRIIDSWALGGGRLPAPEGAGDLPEAASVEQLADGTLTVGMDTSFAPMGFRDEAGQLAGVDVELARALGQALGVEVEFTSMEFDALFGALEGGQIDVAMSAITVTDERQAAYHLIEYLRSGSAILVRQGNPLNIEYPAQLCGHTVGVQEGTVQVEALRAISCH